MLVARLSVLHGEISLCVQELYAGYFLHIIDADDVDYMDKRRAGVPPADHQLHFGSDEKKVLDGSLF